MDVYIITGFMGSGKSTLINLMLPLFDESTAVIVNDDGKVKLSPELSEKLHVEYVLGGCICCTLINSFREAVLRIANEVRPDRIVIEASGLGKVSDAVRAIEMLQEEDIDLRIRDITATVDVSEYADFARGLGDFYTDQVASAKHIVLTHFDDVEKPEDEAEAVREIRKTNPDVVIYRSSKAFLSETLKI